MEAADPSLPEWRARLRAVSVYFFPPVDLNGVQFYLLVASAFFAYAGHMLVPLLTVFPTVNGGLAPHETGWVYGVHGVVYAMVAVSLSYALDRLPALPLVVGGALATAMFMTTLPLVAYVSVPLLVFQLMILLAVCEMLYGGAFSLALKRIVYAHFAGDEERAKRRLGRIIRIMYAASNLMDVFANGTYDVLLHWGGGGSRLATNSVAWLGGVTLLAALVFVLRAWSFAEGTDEPFVEDRRLSLWTLFRSGSFWRFAGISLFLSGVRMIFRHLDLTLTQWIIIMEGDTSHYALVQSINPLVIVCLTPFVPAALGKFRFLKNNPYVVLCMGTFLCALSPLVIAGALSGGLHLYAAAALGVLLFSLGEAIWSPEFLHYTLHIAPEGSEALFTAVASIPSTLIKLPASYASNGLMAHFCSSTLACDGVKLWTSIGLIALTTPVGLIVFQRWLKETRGEDVSSLVLKT
jgi:hypothetical protein